MIHYFSLHSEKCFCQGLGIHFRLDADIVDGNFAASAQDYRSEKAHVFIRGSGSPIDKSHVIIAWFGREYLNSQNILSLMHKRADINIKCAECSFNGVSCCSKPTIYPDIGIIIDSFKTKSVDGESRAVSYLEFLSVPPWLAKLLRGTASRFFPK